MKKYLLTAALTAMVAFCAYGAPAFRTTRTLTLTDGTQVVATFTGDEYNHYWLSEDGTRYVAATDSTYEALSAADALSADNRASLMRSDNQSQRAMRLASAANASTYTGTKRCLIILAQFTDLSFNSTNDDWNNLFNEEGYSKEAYGNYKSIGSVRDYFSAQSYGNFTIEFDVVGPYTVSNTMAYYGQNTSSKTDRYLGTFITEAVNLADEDGVDYSQYDWDGDGYVDQVYVVYAGKGENRSGVSTDAIWPCEGNLNSIRASGYGGRGAISVDGVIVNVFACSNEVNNFADDDSVIEGVGIPCHELSHCLGLRDTYDTGSSSLYGMGYWDIMCSGEYNMDGYVPSGFTSYERWQCGWLEPVTISDAKEVTDMQPLTTSGEAYVIYNQSTANEYYLLENRQQVSWDQGVNGAGLLVTHIDYNASAWSNNTINSVTSHERMTIVPADNVRSTTTEAGDPWPYGNNTALTNESTPAATLYNANSDGTYYLNMPITHITQNSDGTISFVAGNYLDAPVALAATDVTKTGFTANWEAVDGANKYRLVLTGTTKESATDTLLIEDFANFYSTSNNSNTNLSGLLDSYTSVSGWSGSYVYKGTNGLKLGKTNTAGTLTTPTLTATGSVTMELKAQAYSSRDKMVRVSANGTSLGFSTLSADEAQTYTYTTTADGSVYFTVQSSTRCYLSGLTVTLTTGDTSEVTVTTSNTIYTFAGLDLENYNYQYVVYAIDDDITSAASDTITVSYTTGIKAVMLDGTDADNDANVIYNLQGQRVGTMMPGHVYIKGGKKIVAR